MQETSVTPAQFGAYNALQDFQGTFGQIGALLSRPPLDRGQAQWQLSQVMGQLEGLEQRSRPTDPDGGRQFPNVFDELRDRLNNYSGDPSAPFGARQVTQQLSGYLNGVRQHVQATEQHFQISRNQSVPLPPQTYGVPVVPVPVPVPVWPSWRYDPCGPRSDMDRCSDSIFGPGSTRRALPDGFYR
jgi:hypothetical protein